MFYATLFIQTVYTELASGGLSLMKKELIRHHVIISGRVQGVGFRYNTKLRADALGVTGWVKNRSDGTVEVLSEGTPEQLRAFNAYLHDGPISAHVQSVDAISDAPATGEYSTFDIR